jgi:hypothetical protein
MNPFVDIVKVDENRKLIGSKLITVSSTCGHGKTSIIYDMILNYIKSGINVVLFSEQREEAREILFRFLDVANWNRDTIGRLIIFPLFFEDSIQKFNKTMNQYLEFSESNTAIIIDGPMFDLQKNSFSYKKFRNENTRFVILEKYNKKSRLEIVKREEENPFLKRKIIAESLRNLAIEFNTHVIITSQKYRRMEENSSDTSLLYASDICINSEKNVDNTFTITRPKDRFSESMRTFKCIFNRNSLTFETIK